jgi:hypothetical protein
MLSSVLRSPCAVLANVEIMRAFVRLRQMRFESSLGPRVPLHMNINVTIEILAERHASPSRSTVRQESLDKEEAM